MILGNYSGTHHHNTVNWTLNTPRNAVYINIMSKMTRDDLVNLVNLRSSWRSSRKALAIVLFTTCLIFVYEPDDSCFISEI